MKPWDVIIVGAGPAGACTAYLLARRGMAVLLLERAAFGRPKPCGGCVSSRSLALLEEMGLGDVIPEIGAPLTDRIDLHISGRSAVITLRQGVAVSRAALDVALVRRAEQAGAVVRDHCSATLGDIDAHHRQVLANGETLHARLVMAADGVSGTLCDGVIPVRTAQHSYVGLWTIGDAPLSWPRDAITMACGRRGYVGLVRVEQGKLNVAAAMDPRFVHECHGPGDAVRRVLDEAGLASPIHADAAWRGTGLLTRRRCDVAAQRLLVIGDAAGYVEPFTGEGMAWALASAQAVAPLAERAVNKCTHPLFQWQERWERQWRDLHARTVRHRQRTCRTVAWLLRRPMLMHMSVAALNRLPWLARPFVAAIDGRHPRRLACTSME